MNTEIIEDKWILVPIPPQGVYSAIPIDPVGCKPNLNIGLSGSRNRCLILTLPLDFRADFIGQKKENITTLYRKDQYENSIVIELTNNDLSSYFNDTIISLLYKIKDITNVSESTRVFITAINEWCSFFANTSDEKHSLNDIQGFFGELSVLNELLYTADSVNVNNILTSWRGLYDDTNDFYFDSKNIEVKTKRHSKTTVGISSEFQLDAENGKGLELTVVSLEVVIVNGLTINDIVKKVKEKVYSLNGDILILFAALKKKNLTPITLKDYNTYQFRLVSHISYDVNVTKFPKLVRSALTPYLLSISYEINLTNLDELIISNKTNFNL